MKSIKIFISALFSIAFCACEETIDLELPSTDPVTVIEASYIANQDSAVVLISESNDFFEAPDYPKISNAVVRMRVENGPDYVLDELEKGVYSTKLPGNIGNDFKLEITIDGQEFFANAKLNPMLRFDSLSFEKQDAILNNERIWLYAHFQDTPGEEDFARFKISINGVFQEEIYLYEDELSNGNYVDYTFITQDLAVGDTIDVYLYTIDQPVYEYFETLSEIVGENRGLRTTVPDNPSTNISGNATGYFSAYFISKKSIIIK